MSFASAAGLSLLGLVVLTVGAEWLVRGASQLASRLGVSPLVIGLTVVAYGTSAPEIMASVVAALAGHAEMTVGNVVGSNIANIGLILGGSALVAPLALAPTVVRRELPFMVLVTAGLWIAATRLELGTGTGALLVGLLVAFSYLSIQWARADLYVPPDGVQTYNLVSSTVITVAGLAGLLGGAQMLVTGAVSVARGLGLSEFVIGVTLVAIGTSLPELATALIAALKKEGDLVVGTIIGSNVFNVLGAIGVSALFKPIPIDPALLRFEFPVLMLFTVLMAVFLYTGGRMVRWEGAALLLGYFGFIVLVFR